MGNFISNTISSATDFVNNTVSGVVDVAKVVISPIGLIMGPILGPIALLVGGAMQQDQAQQPIVDQAAQDNQAQLDAVAQQQAIADQAVADATSASNAANAVAQQAASDAAAAQQAASVAPTADQAQAAAALATPAAPSGAMTSLDTGGGGGGGGIPVDTSTLTSQSPFDTGGAPSFAPMPVDQSQFMPDMGPMPATSALELSPELQAMVSAPMEQFAPLPDDQTSMLTVSDSDTGQMDTGDMFPSEGQAEGMPGQPYFQGYGKVINYPMAPGISFSKINPQSYEPPLSYDEENAPKYVESGPFLPVVNRLRSRMDLPNAEFMPALREQIPDFNSMRRQPQDIPENLPTKETDYPTHGGQTATNIKRSVLSTAMPIRSDFGDDAGKPNAFDYMLNDLRNLQRKLSDVIMRAEGFKTYDKRFSGMLNLAEVLAPVRSDLDEVESGVKHVERSGKNVKPRTHEDKEKTHIAKQMIKDMNDDIAIVRKFVH